MRHDVEDRYAEADANLIEANHLGALLGVFRLKPVHARLAYWLGIGFIAVGVIILLLAAANGISYWHQSLILQQQHPRTLAEQVQLLEGQERLDSDRFALLDSLLGGSVALLKGLMWLYIGVPRERRKRIIVCERGLLAIRRKIKSDHVDVVRWEDIRTLMRPSSAHRYYVERSRGESIDIDKNYQDAEELVKLIRQYIGDDMYVYAGVDAEEKREFGEEAL